MGSNQLINEILTGKTKSVSTSQFTLGKLGEDSINFEGHS